MFQNTAQFNNIFKHLKIYYDVEKQIEPFCLELLRCSFSEDPKDIPKVCLDALELLERELNSPHTKLERQR